MSLKIQRGRTAQGAPNPIEVFVGKKICMRRKVLGWSQERLASLLGITFQQLQKYERGTNRIGCSRLWDIANITGVDVNFFFEDMDEATRNQSPRHLINGIVPQTPYVVEIKPKEEKLPYELSDLLHAYYAIENRELAHQLRDLVRSIFLLNENKS